MTVSSQEVALQQAVRVVLAMLPQDRDALPDEVSRRAGWSIRC